MVSEFTGDYNRATNVHFKFEFAPQNAISSLITVRFIDSYSNVFK